MKSARSQEIGKEIAENEKRWKEIFRFGCQDPFWEDGVNLNLVRNHILYSKLKCRSELKEDDYPEEFFHAEPPEVENHYMARAKEIRRNVTKTLDLMKKSPDYQWLLENRYRIRQKDEIVHVNAVLAYATNLESAMEKDDLVVMRRFEDANRFLESFYECKERVRKALESKRELPDGQLTIFDVF